MELMKNGNNLEISLFKNSNTEAQPFTYIQTLGLRIKSESRRGPDRRRQIYQNESLNTGCYVFHHFQVDLS